MGNNSLHGFAPIALFVYNRLGHTIETVEALKRNLLAIKSDLVIFSDAPKSLAESKHVNDVRLYIDGVTGFKSVTIIERDINFGLSRSIVDGVGSLVNEYGRIIVLEDDMITSCYFLTYMNEALERFMFNDAIISIHGYTPPVKEVLPEAFFLRGADCWGWATWQRGWRLFNPDGRYLLAELKRQNLNYEFDFCGAFPYSKMLKNQIAGVNDSWAVRWYASAFLAGKLTLYPGLSLVHNIGNDASGTHSERSCVYDVSLTHTPINLDFLEVAPSITAKNAFINYFWGIKGGIAKKLRHFIFQLFRRVNDKSNV